MATKILKKLKKQTQSKPAAVAKRLRKTSLYVMIFFMVPASVAIALILLKIWVPGMAWLE